jgi:hypothetical protein
LGRLLPSKLCGSGPWPGAGCRPFAGSPCERAGPLTDSGVRGRGQVNPYIYAKRARYKASSAEVEAAASGSERSLESTEAVAGAVTLEPAAAGSDAPAPANGTSPPKVPGMKDTGALMLE